MLWRNDQLPLGDLADSTILPYGNGRSYGDVCLNDGGVLIDARPLDRFIHFDREQGVLRCEAGVLLSEILELAVPAGWFLTVTPGTQFVTIGGAIANDVHGKNHHRVGTFGCNVRRFELLRSDGTRLVCSPGENNGWFRASIGGLGLTGLITWAEIQLQPVSSPYIRQETVRYSCLDDFFDLSAASDEDFEYTVAWLDCLARGKRLGRGLLVRGNSARELPSRLPGHPARLLTVPVTPPVSLINHWSLKSFNTLYYHRHHQAGKVKLVHYAPFFYPLDAVRNWNRIYGPRGFLQYQCVVPYSEGRAAIKAILERIAASGTGSFLAVLKIFGDKPSPGILSFPKPGITLALDFPNQGHKTFTLLDRLDQVVMSAKGAVYPAKDARMSAESFQTYFPQWESLKPYMDERFSSSFWRRVSREQT